MDVFHGQGATEYLIILAIVLVVSLVSISLMVSGTSTAKDATASSTAIYWQSQASPLRVIEAKQISGTEYLMVVENSLVDPITIMGVGVDSAPAHYAEYGYGLAGNGSIYMGPGETKQIVINGSNVQSYSGQIVNFDLDFHYRNEYGIEKTQHGEKKFSLVSSFTHAPGKSNQTGGEIACIGNACVPGATSIRAVTGQSALCKIAFAGIA